MVFVFSVLCYVNATSSVFSEVGLDTTGEPLLPELLAEDVCDVNGKECSLSLQQRSSSVEVMEAQVNKSEVDELLAALAAEATKTPVNASAAKTPVNASAACTRLPWTDPNLATYLQRCRAYSRNPYQIGFCIGRMMHQPVACSRCMGSFLSCAGWSCGDSCCQGSCLPSMGCRSCLLQKCFGSFMGCNAR